MKFKKIKLTLRLPFIPLVFSCVIMAVLLSGAVSIGVMTHARIIQHEKLKALGDLGIIRANLEGALNSRLLLGKGLVSYLSVKPGISMDEFMEYSEQLVANDPMIRNISVIKGTTILYAYPLATNQKAIGVDLSKIPAQRAGVMEAIETLRPVVVSRVNLIQGGIATVSRIPILVKKGTEQVYWGQISIVLMQDVLFREAKLFNGSYGLSFCLQDLHDVHTGIENLFGSSSVLSGDPVELDVIFPCGSWRLSAVPSRGWGYSDTISIKYAVFGSILSVVLGILFFFVTYSVRRIHQLESILPICSSCKKIKSEEGRWNSVESYFSGSNNITFSHGLCPECADKLYGKAPWYRKPHDGR